ncbi:gonadotropin subunit beta-1-like [Lampris incognitus]|uniref:gonadotropin subunit beta-1-like n=1 Tax=Lampris incognitus TaxID=2546036 RepID=UPI0024B4A164|nr:gonadotropin subunit beta-1-like [Lampris incognitus]
MQLVVVAAMLALVGARQGCSFGCHPTDISIVVESCGKNKTITTTACAGQCFQEDPVYLRQDDWPRQAICNGEWSYEVTQIEDCPVGVTYPVARNCMCTTCETTNTYCEHFHSDDPSCLPY